MLKQLILIFITVICFTGAYSQYKDKDFYAKPRETFKQNYDRVNRMYNEQVFDIPLNDSIPLHIRMSALITDVAPSKKTPGNKKRINLYMAGNFFEMNAMVLLKRVNFNYFKKYNTYFTVLSSKGKNITDNAYGVVASPAVKKRIQDMVSGVAATSVDVKDFITINFFDQKTDTLIKSFYIKRLEVKPEINAVKADDKIVAASNSIKDIYKVGPNKRVAIEFKERNNWLDTTIQYQLSDPELSDTIWHTSGHHMVLKKLKPDTRYILKVRYKFQKETVNTITILVGPRWYQSLIFYWALGIIAMVILLFNIYLIYRHRLNKQMLERQKVSYELQSVQAQLNPHFIFNSLNSIQGLINTGKIDTANTYLSEFSSLMRSTLDKSSHPFQSLDIELGILETYLTLEKLRFGFNFSIETDNSIDKTTIEIPNLLLQPLVENAVKHGISGMEGKGMLSVLILKEDKDMIIRITDNGSGFDDEETNDGHGIKLTKNKINLINILLGYTAITLQYQRHGTVALLNFNNWL